jgi:hypothetical protein
LANQRFFFGKQRSSADLDWANAPAIAGMYTATDDVAATIVVEVVVRAGIVSVVVGAKAKPYKCTPVKSVVKSSTVEAATVEATPSEATAKATTMETTAAAVKAATSAKAASVTTMVVQASYHQLRYWQLLIERAQAFREGLKRRPANPIHSIAIVGNRQAPLQKSGSRSSQRKALFLLERA